MHSHILESWESWTVVLFWMIYWMRLKMCLPCLLKEGALVFPWELFIALRTRIWPKFQSILLPNTFLLMHKTQLRKQISKNMLAKLVCVGSSLSTIIAEKLISHLEGTKLLEKYMQKETLHNLSNSEVTTFACLSISKFFLLP